MGWRRARAACAITEIPLVGRDGTVWIGRAGPAKLYALPYGTDVRATSFCSGLLVQFSRARCVNPEIIENNFTRCRLGTPCSAIEFHLQSRNLDASREAAPHYPSNTISTGFPVNHIF